MKIFSLNLKGDLSIKKIGSWNQRKANIVDFLTTIKPDLVVFQEAVYRKNKIINQVQELNKELKYSYTYFGQGFSSLSPEWLGRQDVQIGYGVLSKYKISELESIYLERVSKDKHLRSILNFSVSRNNKNYPFTTVHFSPKTDFAKEQLGETLKIIEKRKSERIIVGDFNLFTLEPYKRFFEKKYASSERICDYKSFPAKEERLDYVLLPKKYKFKNFQCIVNRRLSDHAPLVFEI